MRMFDLNSLLFSLATCLTFSFFQRRPASLCCRPLSGSPVRIRGKVPCSGVPQQQQCQVIWPLAWRVPWWMRLNLCRAANASYLFFTDQRIHWISCKAMQHNGQFCSIYVIWTGRYMMRVIIANNSFIFVDRWNISYLYPPTKCDT